jgi:hypothetical protein
MTRARLIGGQSPCGHKGDYPTLDEVGEVLDDARRGPDGCSGSDDA